MSTSIKDILRDFGIAAWTNSSNVCISPNNKTKANSLGFKTEDVGGYLVVTEDILDSLNEEIKELGLEAVRDNKSEARFVTFKELVEKTGLKAEYEERYGVHVVHLYNPNVPAGALTSKGDTKEEAENKILHHINQATGSTSFKDYLHDYALMTDSEELKEYLGLLGDKAHSKIMPQHISDIQKHSGAGILKHAIMDPEFLGKQKQARIVDGLVDASDAANLGPAHFALWASSEDAGALGDILSEELPNLKPTQVRPLVGKIAFENMVDYFKNMDREEYLDHFDKWETKLGDRGEQEPSWMKKFLKSLVRL